MTSVLELLCDAAERESGVSLDAAQVLELVEILAEAEINEAEQALLLDRVVTQFTGYPSTLVH